MGYEPTEDEIVGWFEILERRMVNVHGVCILCMRERHRVALIDKFFVRCTRYGRDLTGALEYADKWMSWYLARRT